MSRYGRTAAIAALTLAFGSTAAAAQAQAPAVPTCERDFNFAYTAPAGHPDAGTFYGPSGPCRMTQYNPTGTPKGTIMLVAAGGWQSQPAYTTTPQIGRMAKVWTDAGFQVVAVEVTSAKVVKATGPQIGKGTDQYTDVVQWYDVLRYYSDLYFGTGYKLCTSGGSSGAHMALMVATLRLPDCIVVEAAPTDLANLPASVKGLAEDAFGAGNLAQWSPAAQPAQYFAMPILMGTLPDDPLVPPAQMSAFAATRPTPSATTMSLATDTAACASYATYIERTFAHLCDGGQAGVSAPAIGAWRGAEVAFVTAVP